MPAKWQPLVEIQFNAPKLSIGSAVPQLTFGTILNAAIIFTKALNVVSKCIPFHQFFKPLFMANKINCILVMSLTATIQI